MSSEVIIGILCVIILTLVIALALTESEKRHWRTQYETLRNAALQDGQAQTRSIIRGLEAVDMRARMTLDEYVDSQG